MATRFPEVYPEEKEIISPDDWNRNLSEFVDEVNGRIDADNLANRESIDSTMVRNRAFQRLFSSTDNSDQFLLNNGFVGWQTLDSGGVSMPSVEFEANTDGWAICEANATWTWQGNGVHREDTLDASGSIETADNDNPFVGRTHEDYQRAQALRSRPPGGWMGTSHGLSTHSTDSLFSYDVGFSDNVKLHGSAASLTSPDATPGSTAADFIMTHGNFPQGWWEDLAVDYYAFKLRIVVDGEPVSESGWIHVGNYRCGTFLCGVTPISAGFHRIELQARAALLSDLYAHRKGLNAKYRDDPKRGKFTSKFSTTTSSAPTPMPVRDGNFGLDCRVRDRNLLVSYRKH